MYMIVQYKVSVNCCLILGCERIAHINETDAKSDIERAVAQWGRLTLEELMKEREQISGHIAYWQERDLEKRVIPALEDNLLLVEMLIINLGGRI